jgi:hypothetical protein
MTTKPAFPALGAVGAWEPSCRGFGIAKILKSCNFTLAKAVIRWMSVPSGRAVVPR